MVCQELHHDGREKWCEKMMCTRDDNRPFRRLDDLICDSDHLSFTGLYLSDRRAIHREEGIVDSDDDGGYLVTHESERPMFEFS